MSNEIIMGITVEELQERINFVYEKSKEQEGVDLKAETNQLKAAIKANPIICQSLLDEDIGKLVATIKAQHASARSEAIAGTAKAKNAKSAAEKKEAKNILKKPISAADIQNEFGDL